MYVEKKGVFVVLVVLAIILSISGFLIWTNSVTISGITGAATGDLHLQATTISECMNISAEGDYILDTDLTNTTTCFTFGTGNVTIDCDGHVVTYGTSTTEGGNGFSDTIGYGNITLMNCHIVEGASYQSFKRGIYINGGENITLINNNITTLTSISHGMDLRSITNLNLTNNTIYTSSDGNAIALYNCLNGTLQNNSLFSPYYFSLYVQGTSREYYNHSIDTNNFAEGRSIAYNFSLENQTVYQDIDLSDTFGEVICGFCINVTYDNVTFGSDGLHLLNVSHSRVFIALSFLLTARE